MKEIIKDIVECAITRTSPTRLQKYSVPYGRQDFWFMCHEFAYDWWHRPMLMKVGRNSRGLPFDPQSTILMNLKAFLDTCPELQEIVVSPVVGP